MQHMLNKWKIPFLMTFEEGQFIFDVASIQGFRINLNAHHVDGMSLIIRYFRAAKELVQIT